MALNVNTTHKPEWISLNEAVEIWLELLLNQPAPQMIPAEVQVVMHSTFSEALRVPEFSIKGAPDISEGRGDNPSGELIEIPALYFRVPRTFCPQRNSIEPHNVSHPVEYAVEAIKGGARHPYWVDVHVHRESFSTWLKGWFRNHLIDELRFGRLNPVAAGEIWARGGTGNLEDNPDPANFDPMTEVFWTLPMAVAWITWGDPQRVVGHWDKYRSQLSRFHFEDWKSGSEEYKGWILRNDGYDNDNPASLWLDNKDWLSAKEKLWAVLQSGEVKAFGENSQGDRLPIDDFLWRDHRVTLREWKKVSVLAKDVQQIGKPAETVSAAPPRIKNPAKRLPAMPPHVMQAWTREHILLNENAQTGIEEELEMIAAENPGYRKPTHKTYSPSRRRAAKALGKIWWCKHGPKKKPETEPECEPEEKIEENSGEQGKPTVDNSGKYKIAGISPELNARLYDRIKIK